MRKQARGEPDGFGTNIGVLAVFVFYPQWLESICFQNQLIFTSRCCFSVEFVEPEEGLVSGSDDDDSNPDHDTRSHNQLLSAIGALDGDKR